MNNIAKTVGERIRGLRQQREWSQERLALKAGINTSYMSEIERGLKKPTIDILEKVSIALDMTLSELFDFDYALSESADPTIMDKIAFELHGRSQMEQEAIYQFIKQLLWFRDKK